MARSESGSLKIYAYRRQEHSPAPVDVIMAFVFFSDEMALENSTVFGRKCYVFFRLNGRPW